MELPHDQGHSGNRGCIKRLLAAVLDSEVEERIGDGEIAFRDERAVEQRLVIDPLGLPGNELMWIFRRGWRRPRGGARSLSFGWVDFLGAIEVDLGVQICKKKKKKREMNRKRKQKGMWREKMKGCAGIYRAQNIHCYTMEKGSKHRRSVSTQRRRDLRCCVPKSGKKATQRRRVLRHCVPESYAAKILCLLHIGVEFYVAAYSKVWNKVFLFFKTRI